MRERSSDSLSRKVQDASIGESSRTGEGSGKSGRGSLLRGGRREVAGWASVGSDRLRGSVEECSAGKATGQNRQLLVQRGRGRAAPVILLWTLSQLPLGLELL